MPANQDISALKCPTKYRTSVEKCAVPGIGLSQISSSLHQNYLFHDIDHLISIIHLNVGLLVGHYVESR